jgi:hypothetical protein
MKKIIAMLLVLVMVVGLLAGCGNQDMWDTEHTFDYALVSFPDGSVQRIEIKQWCTYDGEQIQVTAEDGTVYLFSSINAVLVHED